MNFELGNQGTYKKYTISEITAKAKATIAKKEQERMYSQSQTMGPVREGNWLEGLEVEEETASRPTSDQDVIKRKKRGSESFLEGIDSFGKSLNKIRSEKQEHREGMKKLLGEGYISPTEKYEDFKRINGYLKGL
ncbi:hypothetical protein [Sutcliffiella horikoshii]|uniref:hypothetical protein n=1 Tax=Sutcliffiella horikoshii TaxID=79883 RepID=UPI001F3EC566|nr:hypothetical protein [Sutcliffiella horikoshii]MCG1020784.1 hypothetical protein [Sutcliffiella horikoshii]